jgi:hypothetical protein
MNIVTLIIAAPIVLILIAAAIISFFITLHRRRERAWANSPSIYVPGKVRTIESPYYDTYVIQAGQQVGGTQGFVTMFSQVQGVANSTYPNGVPPNITNMTQSNQLPGGESFLMRALRVVALGMAETDAITFCQNFVMRFQAGTGPISYMDAPPEFWPGGTGTFTPGTGIAASIGFQDTRAITVLDTDPILLTDGVNFSTKLIGTPFTASALFFLRVYLDGQKTQPAQ